ncbi:hypothetical protein GCM10010319_20230 [Streptomyces blastmyceticus]|uniref:Uncharacterized protein n=1 Tax=Streptomyces blastmyceticus TaxID=68180 RepID=A0ABP3GFA9_9ACTN
MAGDAEDGQQHDLLVRVRGVTRQIAARDVEDGARVRRGGQGAADRQVVAVHGLGERDGAQPLPDDFGQRVLADGERGVADLGAVHETDRTGDGLRPTGQDDVPGLDLFRKRHAVFPS